ncbi:MAG TPA: DUF2125 domain-containing protein [Acetobacteraceae bacterium]|nr:DUF2125 domain-containing protein [Acetobacteraceae bacterium]
MRRRSWILLTALLLLAVAIGDTLVWHFAVQRMRAGLAGWVAATRAAGWSVSSAAPEAGGWPLAATLVLRDVALQGGAADIPDGLAWRAERVVLRVALRRPRVLRIDAEGAQHLRLSDAPDIRYTATRLQVLVPLQADPSAQALDLHGETLRASVPVAGADDTLTLSRLDADAVLDAAAPHGRAVVSISVKAGGIGLPSRLKWPLGPRIASFAADAALNGPLPNASGLAARAAAWRDDGGSVRLRRVAMQWGPLGLTATATLTLDPALQPVGTGTAQVTGYAATLDALARNGLIRPSAAIAAKAVLSLLATTPDGGGPSEVEVPLTLQHRTLSMRQAPLVRLPELDWPQP